jgi:hypothetical protein
MARKKAGGRRRGDNTSEGIIINNDGDETKK